MTRRAAFLCAALLAACVSAAASRARANADGDWAQIEAMDHGAPGGNWTSRDEARTAALDYMAKQERALRDFESNYPGDPRVFDAELRLAHLLATRTDLLGAAADTLLGAEAIFARLESDPKFAARRGDVAFARLSLFMQRMDTTAADARADLLARVRRFATDFPEDRRVAALLAETAGVFQDSPATARALLEQARPVARDEETRSRIEDDLKRLALLGQPLAMKWTSVQGQPVNLAKLRGKVVLIYFFASWSAPSMAELDWVRKLAAGYEPGQVQALGVCLDRDPVTLPGMLADRGIAWPVYCDGAGWTGPLVRGLGINALPALWIVDRNGVLRSLHAKQEAGAMVTQLLNERRKDY